jgi:hypothetical protein
MVGYSEAILGRALGIAGLPSPEKSPMGHIGEVRLPPSPEMSSYRNVAARRRFPFAEEPVYQALSNDRFRVRRHPGGISDQAKEFAELIGIRYGGWERQPHDHVYLRGDCLLPNLALQSRYYCHDLTHSRRLR